MIKVISFDIGGTLIEYDSKDAHRYNLKALSNLVNLDYGIVRDAYKVVFQKTKADFNELVDEFCCRLKIKRNKKLEDFFSNKFQTKTIEKVSLDKIEIIKDLKSKGYKVILFSNSCCLIDNSAISKLVNIVDEVFYSYDIGYTKNEVESYRYIENKINNKSADFLHVGDDLNSDYKVPVENGWKALYYGQSDKKDINQIKNFCGK